MAMCAGCTRLPESFPPPRQRTPLTVPHTGALGFFLSMTDPNADVAYEARRALAELRDASKKVPK